jgi:hypothetical protein
MHGPTPLTPLSSQPPRHLIVRIACLASRPSLALPLPRGTDRVRRSTCPACLALAGYRASRREWSPEQPGLSTFGAGANRAGIERGICRRRDKREPRAKAARASLPCPAARLAKGCHPTDRSTTRWSACPPLGVTRLSSAPVLGRPWPAVTATGNSARGRAEAALAASAEARSGTRRDGLAVAALGVRCAWPVGLRRTRPIAHGLEAA